MLDNYKEDIYKQEEKIEDIKNNKDNSSFKTGKKAYSHSHTFKVTKTNFTTKKKPFKGWLIGLFILALFTVLTVKRLSL